MKTKLIYKYLADEASEEEVRILFEWIEASSENKKYFINIKKTWTITALTATNSHTIPVISIKPKNKLIAYTKYAAVFLIIFGLGKLAFNFYQKTNHSKEIVLELSDGRLEYFTEENKTTLFNESGGVVAEKFPDSIRYFGKVADDKVVFNSLKIPYGKRFKLSLSDGTVVHLNSGSTLRYPEQFGINGNRQLYLVGEAFFEVAKDKKHPFIVNANQIAIEVLGTQFNVSAYPENSTVNSVLTEGSIQMYETANTANAVLLKPGQMVTWNKKLKKMTVNDVDPVFYSAWTKGELAFKDTPFSIIEKMIQRTYDVEIVNKNTDLANQCFTGTIKISESSVENILELLKRDTPFNYSVKQKTVTITNIP